FAAEQWLFTQSWLSSRNKVEAMVRNHGDLSQPAYLMGLLVAAGVFLGVRNLSRTRVARAFRAIRDSENTAISMGINPTRYKLLAFALSGGIAGLAGGCAAYLHTTIVAGNFTFIGSLNFLVLIVIAGLGFIAGGVITAIVGWIVPALLLGHAAGVNNGPYIIVAFLAIRTVIDYPNGIAGFWTRFLRPFDPGERVAWASAEQEGAAAPAAAAAELTEDESDFEHAAELLEGAGV
ncbi:MAG TPA: branched-chain amino acid ABC transporter permease, partial [Candidatus Acidoferrum sp.]|nr:branched-chain amino acid ABC transporter permease [Candidatus Acidoferrum sp.]